MRPTCFASVFVSFFTTHCVSSSPAGTVTASKVTE